MKLKSKKGNNCDSRQHNLLKSNLSFENLTLSAKQNKNIKAQRLCSSLG